LPSKLADNLVHSPLRNIVIIEPDLGLRQSLTFALEVEGYRVEALDTWRKAHIPITPTLCMIIDDNLLRSREDARRYLRDLGQTVILLTDGVYPAVNDDGLILTKPFEGADLLRLVRSLETVD
jgi:DNA-binding response OmpR family regulator